MLRVANLKQKIKSLYIAENDPWGLILGDQETLTRSTFLRLNNLYRRTIQVWCSNKVQCTLNKHGSFCFGCSGDKWNKVCIVKCTCIYTYREFKTTISKSVYSIPQHTWKCTRMAELEERQLTYVVGSETHLLNRVRWQALVDEPCSTRNEKDWVSEYWYNEVSQYRKKCSL